MGSDQSPEYTGQLCGGPDDGNLVTSTVPEFHTETEYRQWLDGPNREPTVVTVVGMYEWDARGAYFLWKPGPAKYDSYHRRLPHGGFTCERPGCTHANGRAELIDDGEKR